jgi:predicted restriction endonuclease
MQFRNKGVKLASELVNNREKPEKRKKPPIDKRLDSVWSKLVKLKAGNKCAVCGKQTALNSHHIYSRAKMSLRWSIENGICLCVGHHIGVNFSAHKSPIEFSDWLINKLGTDFMDGLKLMAHTSSNLHQFEKELLLKELKAEIRTIKLIN